MNIFLSLLFNISFNDFLVYGSHSSTEVSYCPERLFLSPIELLEVSLESLFSEYLMRTSSFEKLNDMRDWMNKRNTEIYMDMIFFHTNSYWSDIEFFTDLFKYLLYFFLRWFCKTSSSVFCYPYYVISAVIHCMWSFSVSHVVRKKVLPILDTIVTIGLKTNGVLNPRFWNNEPLLINHAFWNLYRLNFFMMRLICFI